jgi:putative endonuclease
MPYFIYILISKKDNKMYVGCTTDLEQRLVDHNSGKVSATKNRRPFEIIYSEKYTDKAEAFNRERYLKSLWSARFKKKLLTEYVNKVGHK